MLKSVLMTKREAFIIWKSLAAKEKLSFTTVSRLFDAFGGENSVFYKKFAKENTNHAV